MSVYHEIIEALNPLINAFDQIGIFYYIGGSVSSSLHGISRRTQDVDIIADIQPHQVKRLVQLLQNDYYVDEQALNDAVRRSLPYLVSADFLASEYSYSTEMKRAMEMHEAGIARVIPIILRHTLWETAPFGKLQALPKRGKSTEPVTSSHWQNMDEAFLNVVKGIREIIEELTGTQLQVTSRQFIPTHFQPIVPVGFPRARTLVGRDADLAKLMEHLRAGETSNICALHGMGGVGKTSLAAAVVARLSQDHNAFPGGAAWISCEGFAGPEGLHTIWKRIASALRLEQITTRVKDEEIRVLLASELTQFPRLLLVLDNVEPQLDADILLNTLAVPGHTVLLLTSRQALTPEKLTVLQLRHLANDDAIILFSQRIEQADSGRSLQDEMGEIATVVTALGGLPLAIELVAAYAGIQCLPLSQILLELEQDKVEATSLNFDPRKALLSRFRRSWMALTCQEQRLFAGLSLLKGMTFPRAAALALAQVAKGENSIPLENMYFGGIVPHAQQDLSKLVAYALVEPLPNQQLCLHPLLGEYALLCFNELQSVVRENLKTAFAVFWSEYSSASYEGLPGLEAYRAWQIAREAREKMKQLKTQAGFSQSSVFSKSAQESAQVDSILDLLRIGSYVARHGEPNLGQQLIERSLAESAQYQLEGVRAECHLELAEIDVGEKDYDNAVKHYRVALRLYQENLRLNKQRLKKYRKKLKRIKGKEGKIGLEVEIRLFEERVNNIYINLEKIQKDIQNIPVARSRRVFGLRFDTKRTLCQNKTRGLIRVEQGKEPRRTYEIRSGSLRIGRDLEADIFLEENSVSRIHATLLSLGEGRYGLRDEGSTNGTRLKQQLNFWSLTPNSIYPLRSGDIIYIGHTILIFIIEEQVGEG